MFNRSNSGGRVIPDDEKFPTYTSDSFIPKNDLGFFPQRRASEDQIKTVELIRKSSNNTQQSAPPLSKPSNHF